MKTGLLANVAKGCQAEQAAAFELEADGWLVDVMKTFVNRQGNYVKQFQHEPFGFADLIAIKPGEPVLFVQVTDGGDLSHRLNRGRSVDWPSTARAEVWERRGDGFTRYTV